MYRGRTGAGTALPLDLVTVLIIGIPSLYGTSVALTAMPRNSYLWALSLGARTLDLEVMTRADSGARGGTVARGVCARGVGLVRG